MNLSAKKVLMAVLVVTMIMVMGTAAMAKTYTVGTSASFPPFEYVENGEVTGFDIDLIKEIGKVEGFEVQVKDLSFDSLIPALKTGNIDIIAAGMTITEKREKQVDFTEPYFVANQSVVVQEESGRDLTVLFGDNKIGVQTSTTGDLWVTDNLKKKDILTGQIARYDKYIMVFTDLVNGNLDGVVLDTPVAKKYSESRPVKIVGEIKTGEKYGIAVKEGNKELLNKLNNGLKKLREEGKIGDLVSKYF